MNIGVIEYKRYVERILLDYTFIMNDLFNIILHDTEYVKFQVIDAKECLLLSTYYPDTGDTVEYIEIIKAEREVDILGTTYDAYRTPSLRHKTKITWNAGHARFNTKKEANKYVEKINGKARFSIEKFIETRKS